MVIEGGQAWARRGCFRRRGPAPRAWRFASGRGMADPIDSVVELAPLMEALFGATHRW